MTKDGCFKVANYTSLKKKTTISDGSTLSANNVNLGGGFEYKPYQPSEAVTQAQTMLQQQVGAKPGPYTSQWEGQLNAIMDRINNRQPFKYDLNGDALYNQYKNQHVQQGRMAMMDTMGQAAALTGGYGNSYAQGVGQQAYQGYLQQLNDRIPELYQLALDQYDREGQDLYNRYGLISDRENTDYGRYQDGYNAWLNERDYLAGRYDAERDYDYGMYADDRDFTYGQHRDSVADQQWQMQFDEAMRQYEEGKKTRYYSGGRGGGGDDDTTPGNADLHPNPGYDAEKIKSIQAQAGIPQDGVWNDRTAAAYANGIRPKSAPTATQKITFADVGERARQIASTNGDVRGYLNQARQAGYITTSQYKSLIFTFGY